MFSEELTCHICGLDKDAFEDVQNVTHCSTGCGGCHQKVLDLISEIMMSK